MLLTLANEHLSDPLLTRLLLDDLEPLALARNSLVKSRVQQVARKARVAGALPGPPA